MEVRFIFFAGCRDAAGRHETVAQLADGSTVQDARVWLTEAHPRLARILPTARVAVDREFATDDQPLHDGAEVVLIPPVSGGVELVAELTHDPIAHDEARARISEVDAGAVITFAGVVRPTSKGGRAVTDLYYEAYEPMAREKLKMCLAEAMERFPLLDAAVVHRLGQLQLGDVAVSIAVSSRHRKEAFEGCAYIIDRLKDIVPIWKKETGPDGTEWVSEGA